MPKQKLVLKQSKPTKTDNRARTLEAEPKPKL